MQYAEFGLRKSANLQTFFNKLAHMIDLTLSRKQLKVSYVALCFVIRLLKTQYTSMVETVITVSRIRLLKCMNRFKIGKNNRCRK